MTTFPADTATRLEALAAAVARLRPDWRDAEAFYEARSEIVGTLRALARSLAMSRLENIAPAGPMPRATVALPIAPAPRVVASASAAAPAPATAPPRPRARRHRFPRPPALLAQAQLWPCP
jgi:hypothetical protein